jgi:hypothetical protein
MKSNPLHYHGSMENASLSQIAAALNGIPLLPDPPANAGDELYYETDQFDLFFELGAYSGVADRYRVLLSGMATDGQDQVIPLLQEMALRFRQAGIDTRIEYYEEHPDGPEFEESISL